MFKMVIWVLIIAFLLCALCVFVVGPKKVGNTIEKYGVKNTIGRLWNGSPQ
jgi:hypothetical protein